MPENQISKAELIIAQLKTEGWKEQMSGTNYINGTIGTNLLKDGEVVNILVQRETDIVHLRLIEYLAFGKEVFLGIREFWLTISRKCAGRPV